MFGTGEQEGLMGTGEQEGLMGTREAAGTGTRRGPTMGRQQARTAPGRRGVNTRKRLKNHGQCGTAA